MPSVRRLAGASGARRVPTKDPCPNAAVDLTKLRRLMRAGEFIVALERSSVFLIEAAFNFWLVLPAFSQAFIPPSRLYRCSKFIWAVWRHISALRTPAAQWTR